MAHRLWIFNECEYEYPRVCKKASLCTSRVPVLGVPVTRVVCTSTSTRVPLYHRVYSTKSIDIDITVLFIFIDCEDDQQNDRTCRTTTLLSCWLRLFLFLHGIDPRSWALSTASKNSNWKKNEPLRPWNVCFSRFAVIYCSQWHNIRNSMGDSTRRFQ